MAKKQNIDLEPGEWVHDYQGIFYILDNTGDRIYFDWYEHSGKLISRNTSLTAATMRKHEDNYGLRLATESERDLCLRRGAANEEQTLARLLMEAVCSVVDNRLSEPDLHDLIKHFEERGDPRAGRVQDIQRRLDEARGAYQQIRGNAFSELLALAPEALSREMGLPKEGPSGPPGS
jgi:hypothetical protein